MISIGKDHIKSPKPFIILMTQKCMICFKTFFVHGNLSILSLLLKFHCSKMFLYTWYFLILAFRTILEFQKLFKNSQRFPFITSHKFQQILQTSMGRSVEKVLFSLRILENFCELIPKNS